MKDTSSLNHRKKIILVTSGQPSLNPRLVKEADALTAAGYTVTVLYSYRNSWGSKFDRQLITDSKWKAICVGGTPARHKLTFLLSKIIYKLALLGARKISLPLFADLAIARNSYHLIKRAKKEWADLYIAHNLGALPAVVKSAKLHGKSCGFDAEDFHRNELSNEPDNFDVILKTHLENKYVTQTDYLTASSPQIADAYRKLYPEKALITLLNVFNRPKPINGKAINRNPILKLFWFSQTIGINRGIENIIMALNNLRSSTFELHLLGDVQQGPNKAYFEKLIDPMFYKVHFHDVIAPDRLITFASQFDIGLALEPAFSINNDIALSNKIFTYMQAGLAIIASDTTAQLAFMEQYPGMGQVYRQKDIRSLELILSTYVNDSVLLNQHQQQSFSYANETLNWEIESKKFLNVVNSTLKPKR